MAWFSWRPDYKERLSVEPETGAVEAEASKPWYSSLGIYHHYTLQVRPRSWKRTFAKFEVSQERRPLLGPSLG